MSILPGTGFGRGQGWWNPNQGRRNPGTILPTTGSETPTTTQPTEEIPTTETPEPAEPAEVVPPPVFSVSTTWKPEHRNYFPEGESQMQKNWAVAEAASNAGNPAMNVANMNRAGMSLASPRYAYERDAQSAARDYGMADAMVQTDYANQQAERAYELQARLAQAEEFSRIDDWMRGRYQQQNLYDLGMKGVYANYLNDQVTNYLSRQAMLQNLLGSLMGMGTNMMGSMMPSMGGMGMPSFPDFGGMFGGGGGLGGGVGGGLGGGVGGGGWWSLGGQGARALGGNPGTGVFSQVDPNRFYDW